MIAPEKSKILQDRNMVENYGTQNYSPGKKRNITGPKNCGKCTTGKLMPWKMIAPEKDRMENDSPRKRWKMTGLENDGKCTTRK